MNRILSIIAVFIFGMSSCVFASQTIILDGMTTTYKDIVNIADGAKVEIKAEAIKRVEKSHNVLISAAESGHKIYGLTVGVGLNKDRQMVDASGKLSQEVVKASQEFNKGLIHAHCGAVGKILSIRQARAIVATRLNNMLYGATGVQPEVVLMLKDMLNKGITPIIPETGSIGMGDITILGHLGLPMIAEGNVFYQGKEISAASALKSAGLKPVTLFGKDALSIVSSNTLSAAKTALLMDDMVQLIKVSKLVYALSLEALNGNIAPFSEEAMALRPFVSINNVAKDIRTILKGSYLWNSDDSRGLQDPLSFRDAVHYMGALESAFNELNDLMQIQFNSSDDNPGVLIETKIKPTTPQEVKLHVKSGGAVVPTSNFEPVLWAIALEKLSVTLGVNSIGISQRTIKLSDDYFTNLSRFLGTDKTVHAFGAMQKPFAALTAENLYLSNPAITFNTSVAGNIEDISTNAPFITQKVQKQIDNLFLILGMELTHAAQAIDLRTQKGSKSFVISPITKKLYGDFRNIVEFMDTDRPLSTDFEKSADFLKKY